ncbi:hypothetical protein TNCT_244631 [Trichonephila clavata]|uniref:Uncharacterized protein n=1 Tax=Trichonephila clavata TaxID=2740835 RepID=A0A8X6FJI4_TRICU|nr:hypothetical protein TNCT_244631 [Trichonephila clavata]
MTADDGVIDLPWICFHFPVWLYAPQKLLYIFKSMMKRMYPQFSTIAYLEMKPVRRAQSEFRRVVTNALACFNSILGQHLLTDSEHLTHGLLCPVSFIRCNNGCKLPMSAFAQVDKASVFILHMQRMPHDVYFYDRRLGLYKSTRGS